MPNISYGKYFLLEISYIPNEQITIPIKSRMYTDGSLMEDRVGCAIICEAREFKIRLPKQMPIFNAEAVAILEAIKATRRWGIVKKLS
jgi:hypothetical protein